MNTTTNQILEQIANVMGGNFQTGQIGEPGNIAGMPGLLGCPAPVVQNSGSCLGKRQKANKKDEDRISKLVSILMKKTMPGTVLKEAAAATPKGGTSLSTNVSGGKAPIAGINDKLADNLPPGKVILPKANKLAKGINGLEVSTPNLSRVTRNLASAAKRFPQANIDVGAIITSPRDVYRTSNAVGSASRSNNLTGIEMGAFFPNRDNEDTESINTNTQRNTSMLKYFKSKLH